MLQYMLNAHYLDRYDPNEILNYGCWCQTNPDHINHRRGTPVDSVDRKCQNWYRCQRCVSMDTFGQCSASEVILFKKNEMTTFLSKYIPFTLTQLPRVSSAPARTLIVKIWRVNVTLLLWIRLFSVWMNSTGEDLWSCFKKYSIFINCPSKYSYYANSHGWEPSTQCTPNPFSRGPPDQCCGTYPTRYPYNSEDGNRGCCNGHTFNSLTHECCNTVLLAAGSCPQTTTPAPNPCSPDPCQNGTCMDTSADTGISG